MKLEILKDTGTVRVTLSERNLLALFAKLHDPDSICTIYNTKEVNGVPTTLILVAEEDDVHYGDRKPGLMAPKTEKIIQKIQVSVKPKVN